MSSIELSCFLPIFVREPCVEDWPNSLSTKDEEKLGFNQLVKSDGYNSDQWTLHGHHCEQVHR